MPYIKDDAREKFEKILEKISTSNFETAGELNYFITKICHAYLRKHGFSYQTLNDIFGVFECAKLELYRRKTAPYEDLKIHENGDV